MSARRDPFLWIGAGIVAALALVAILAPALAPYDPRAATGPSLAGPSAQHLLGTNDAGQDILSQLVWGTRASAVVGLLAASLAVALGALVGATAATLGGRTDLLAMRVVDLFLAVPALPLIIVIAALAGPTRGTVIFVIALAGWPGIARIVRSRALTLARSGYVEAARGFGAPRRYVVAHHALPALGPIIAASFVTWAGTAIVLQAGLAFLGLSDPTEVSWGGVLNRALGYPGVYVTSQWLWWVLPVGLAITVAAIGLAFLGVALEPRSNPRWGRT
ncbi:MAG: ABC transporter permease [Actinomycetota bacterium]|nr:ABC transporter permease [Actinomycetota bacterium]